MTSSVFWDKIAHKYANQPVPDEDAYKKKLSMTQDYLKPHSQVLELACGTGTTALHHAAKAGHIRAVDISENMIAIAKKKQQSMGISNVSFDCAAIHQLEAEDASYDLVMAHSILHLVENRQQVLDKIFQLLKPGGIFVSNTPCLKNAYRWAQPLLPLMRFFGRWPDVYFFSDQQIIKEIESQGFTLLKHWQPKKKSSAFIIAQKTQ